MFRRNYTLEFDDEVVIMSVTLPHSKKELSWSILVKTYRDVSFDYAPIFADDHAEGNVDLICLGIDLMNNVPLPVMVLEAHQNGTWMLLPMVSANETTEDKQEARDSYWYVRGDESVLVECLWHRDECTMGRPPHKLRLWLMGAS
ncbi:hypothetical protein Cantr_04692 [Candida viswanathii]|uniref:Uncharacterized protein n=1 Tax=Candida viswanathii TaxID=5486 RepID=A0A367XPG2_9ASCO|nr:hypothetical protein Cantr_04692 [Candida viswanathii]